MILTLTPNPTIDRTVFVRGFQWGQAVRAEREVVTPSGKGVDASLVVHELGGETVALGLNAGLAGGLLASMLDERGVSHDLTPADGETRTATVLVDLARGDQSTISAPTLHATGSHLDQLQHAVDRHAGQSWGLILGGSLPRGLPRDAYARLVLHARRHGLVTLLDTSGEALRCGIEAQPHVLKVNRHELAPLRPELADLGSGEAPQVANLALHLADVLGHRVADALVVTLGARGSVVVTQEGAYHALPPRVPVSNTAGAGDALGAGLMLALSRGEGWPAALALGTAAAASVVMNEGTGICQRDQVEALRPRVRVARIG